MDPDRKAPDGQIRSPFHTYAVSVSSGFWWKAPVEVSRTCAGVEAKPALCGICPWRRIVKLRLAHAVRPSQLSVVMLMCSWAQATDSPAAVWHPRVHGRQEAKNSKVLWP